MEEQLKYLQKVAQRAFDYFGDDYYAALNVAECIVKDTEEEHLKMWTSRVHAVLEGEL